jgi:hypothetical protein
MDNNDDWERDFMAIGGSYYGNRRKHDEIHGVVAESATEQVIVRLTKRMRVHIIATAKRTNLFR